jgi:hypothetical protein
MTKSQVGGGYHKKSQCSDLLYLYLAQIFIELMGKSLSLSFSLFLSFSLSLFFFLLSLSFSLSFSRKKKRENEREREREKSRDAPTERGTKEWRLNAFGFWRNFDERRDKERKRKRKKESQREKWGELIHLQVFYCQCLIAGSKFQMTSAAAQKTGFFFGILL